MAPRTNPFNKNLPARKSRNTGDSRMPKGNDSYGPTFKENGRYWALDKTGFAVDMGTVPVGSRNASYRGPSNGSLRVSSRGTPRYITAPAARGSIVRNPQPMFRNLGEGGLIFSHAEPFTTFPLTALGALNTQRIAMIPPLLPYLNGIAQNFSKYCYASFEIYYVPVCPSDTEGEIVMGLSYERLDNIGTFLQLATKDKAVSFSPWLGSTSTGTGNPSIMVDCTKFEKPWYPYVSQTSFNSAAVNDQTSLCPFSFDGASQGSTVAVATAGRVWARYTIKLIEPVPAAINV